MLLAFVSGCGGPAPTDAGPCELDASAPRWLVLGTGDVFMPVADGDSIEVIHGPQGGFHLEVTARFGLEVSPDMHVLRYDVTRTDGTTLGTTQIALNERRLARTCGGWQRDGDIVMLTITAPTDVADTEVDVLVQLLGADGALARDERRVHVVDDVP
jgi:hypothetical protein